MNPYVIMKMQKKANAEKTLQIKELKTEINLLKKENAWLHTRVEKLLERKKEVNGNEY